MLWKLDSSTSFCILDVTLKESCETSCFTHVSVGKTKAIFSVSKEGFPNRQNSHHQVAKLLHSLMGSPASRSRVFFGFLAGFQQGHHHNLVMCIWKPCQGFHFFYWIFGVCPFLFFPRRPNGFLNFATCSSVNLMLVQKVNYKYVCSQLKHI